MATRPIRDTLPIPGLRLRIPRLLGAAPLPRSPGLWIVKQLWISRLLGTPGLWIPEPTAILSLFRFRRWISGGRLFRRSCLGALVAWRRVHYGTVKLNFYANLILASQHLSLGGEKDGVPAEA